MGSSFNSLGEVQLLLYCVLGTHGVLLQWRNPRMQSVGFVLFCFDGGREAGRFVRVWQCLIRVSVVQFLLSILLELWKSYGIWLVEESDETLGRRV